uniref:Uncharacterized protein n=1 Tax=Ixodes ricinus TaxID=34613 RepID=A0A6B0UNU2_IXORI
MSCQAKPKKTCSSGWAIISGSAGAAAQKINTKVTSSHPLRNCPTCKCIAGRPRLTKSRQDRCTASRHYNDSIQSGGSYELTRTNQSPSFDHLPLPFSARGHERERGYVSKNLPECERDV